MVNIQVFSAVLVLAALSGASHGRTIDKESFIVGGTEANIADFPYQLAYLDMTRGGYQCGASNIHRLWALTAAHCVDFGTPAELVNLWGGSTSRLSGGHLFFVQRYVLHPGYNRQTLDLDIAIIEVHVTFAKSIP